MAAPGRIRHIGWCPPIQYWNGSSWVYAVEWSYDCPHGISYALMDEATEEEVAAGLTPDALEAAHAERINRFWTDGVLMRECACGGAR